MTASSPKTTFAPDAAKDLLRLRDPCPNFPEADIPHDAINYGDAAPHSNVSEAQEANFAKLGSHP